jgi:phosphomevalonate kinase
MMLAGEYAVLHGRQALVAAVDRRVRLTLRDDGSKGDCDASPDAPGLPPEALVAREIAGARLGAVGGIMTLDVSSLRSDGGERKLGLGSSAAAAVAAAAAVHAAHGRDARVAEVRHAILRDAMAGHRRVAPEGSGADVAASALGGIVVFRREGDDFEASEARLPSDLSLRVVWTGVEARTSDLVAQVGALRASDPASHGAAIDRIAEAADQLIDAALRGDTASVVSAAAAHGVAMEDLGVRAGVPIVNDGLGRVIRLARGSNGAAKPSGAGGGDVAIAFFADEDAARHFEAACKGAGFPLLSFAFGADGVSIDEGPEDS